MLDWFWQIQYGQLKGFKKPFTSEMVFKGFRNSRLRNFNWFSKIKYGRSNMTNQMCLWSDLSHGGLGKHVSNTVIFITIFLCTNFGYTYQIVQNTNNCVSLLFSLLSILEAEFTFPITLLSLCIYLLFVNHNFLMNFVRNCTNFNAQAVIHDQFY